MDDRLCYDQCLPAIMEIDVSDVREPTHIPVNVLLEEADALGQWCQPDKDALTARGVDWELVEHLEIRMGALREAQADFYVDKNTDTDIAKEWKSQFAEAKQLMKEIIEAFRYAFRNHPAAQKVLEDICKEKNDSISVLFKLARLALLGKDEENVASLAAINFDTALLDRANSLSASALDLRSQANRDRKGDKDTKKIRNRAYTYLLAAVKEIRRCGKFVFRLDEERLVGYRSTFVRKKYLRQAAQKKKPKRMRKKRPRSLPNNLRRYPKSMKMLKITRLIKATVRSLIGDRCRGNASVLALEHTTPSFKPIIQCGFHDLANVTKLCRGPRFMAPACDDGPPFLG